MKADVTDERQVEQLVATVVRAYGRLDAAFNNAGILPPTAPLASFATGHTFAVDGGQTAH